MGLCASKPMIMVHHKTIDQEGAGHLTVDSRGKINTIYEIWDDKDPQPLETLRRLERKTFQEICNNPGLDYKPRENLRKHFCQFNTADDHGRIATPPARVTSNPDYQTNLAKGFARI